LAVRTAAALELDPDRYLPVAGVELGEVWANVTDGCYSDHICERLRRYKKPTGKVFARDNPQFRALKCRAGDNVREQRDALHLACQLGGDITNGVAVSAGYHE
jgi:hypothetical protein